MWKQVYSILLLAERQTKEARARLSGPGISSGMTFVGQKLVLLQFDEEHVGGLHRI